MTECESSVSLSVIICTRNRAQRLHKTLESLLAQEPPPRGLEIVVVDNGSTDETSDVIRSFAARGLVRSAFESAPGLGRARNRGVSVARGRFLAFTDDDVIVHKDWAARIVSAFEENLAISAVFGYTYADADVPVLYSLRTRPNACYLEGKEAVWESSPGNNMAYRAGVPDQIGSFDVSLGRGARFATGEDAEFQYRFFKAGLKAYYDPAIRIKHQPDLAQRAFDQEILDCDAGIAAWYGKHAVSGDMYAARLFLIHLGRSVIGIRSLVRAVRRADVSELRLRRRRLRVLLGAFFSKALMELRE